MKYSNSTTRVGIINLKNGILQGDTMSHLLFVLAINPIMNKLDKIIEGVKIKKEEKVIKLNKIVYMDDLKIFVNEKENIEEIDNAIIRLYEKIGMKINEKQS